MRIACRARDSGGPDREEAARGWNARYWPIAVDEVVGRSCECHDGAGRILRLDAQVGWNCHDGRRRITDPDFEISCVLFGLERRDALDDRPGDRECRARRRRAANGRIVAVPASAHLEGHHATFWAGRFEHDAVRNRPLPCRGIGCGKWCHEAGDDKDEEQPADHRLSPACSRHARRSQRCLASLARRIRLDPHRQHDATDFPLRLELLRRAAQTLAVICDPAFSRGKECLASPVRGAGRARTAGGRSPSA
jgi:hypothetical protein